MGEAGGISSGRRAASLSGSLSLLAAVAFLAGCNPMAGPGFPLGRDLGAPPPRAPAPAAAQAVEQIGSGSVKLALVVPLTQASGPSLVGASMRNAAQLAYADAGANDVSILVKDDRSTPAGAAEATQAALNEGAELVIGPVSAPNVREASRVARAAGRPVIAFSTDATAATKGVYLLSFLVESNVERIVDFAAQRGKKSIAALIPDTAYGAVALAQFQQSAANHGFRVLTIERYRTLVTNAQGNLEKAGVRNVIVRQADGSTGLAGEGTFDRILITAAFESLPRVFADHLVSGGIMLVPIMTSPNHCRMVRLSRTGSRFDREDLFEAPYLPIVPQLAAFL